MIGLERITDAYKKVELEFIVHMKSECNVADALSRVKVLFILKQDILTGKIDHPSNQWINRTNIDHLDDRRIGKYRTCRIVRSIAKSSCTKLKETPYMS